MACKTPFYLSAFAVVIAGAVWRPGPAISGEAALQSDGVRYRPIQSISYDFGSKSMSGYFVRQGSVCVLSLMVTEKQDPDRPSHVTATRVRLMMDPGQVAGLDSEEGRSVNFTCGKDAAVVIVNCGERPKLIAQQDVAVSDTVADRVEAER